MKAFAATALFVAAWAAAPVPARSAQPHYELKSTFKLGGEGSWDYLTFDPAGRRLFITRETRVQVVDPERGTILAELPGLVGVHGIALAPDLGRAVTSNGRANAASVFDLKTLRHVMSVPLRGKNPDAIVYDPATKLVLTFNGRSQNASVIDPQKPIETTTIALDGRPEFAAADGRGTVFVDIEDADELQAIDARSAKVTATWPLPGCEGPAGLSMDLEHRRLFVGCRNRALVVVDADRGKVVASLPIGQGVDATAFDPRAQLVFSSNGDGTLNVIAEESPDKYVVVQNVATEKGARTMALDPVSGDVFLVTADFVEAPSARPNRTRPVPAPGTFRLLVFKRS